jgi:metal-dependent HD superfamily phosphatase/phosphodiesterase
VSKEFFHSIESKIYHRGFRRTSIKTEDYTYPNSHKQQYSRLTLENGKISAIDKQKLVQNRNGPLHPHFPYDMRISIASEE